MLLHSICYTESLGKRRGCNLSKTSILIYPPNLFGISPISPSMPSTRGYLRYVKDMLTFCSLVMSGSTKIHSISPVSPFSVYPYV